MSLSCCNYKNCKKKCYFNLNSIKLCFNHINILYYKQIVYIQKIFKGYYARRKIKNIFIKLPYDIQQIIIYYINEPIYYKNLITTYNKIIIKKSLNFSHITKSIKKTSLNEISNLYYLSTKYISILNINFLKYLYVISNELSDIINMYMFSIVPSYSINNILLHNILLTDLNHEVYFKIMQNIYKFKQIYNNRYNIIKVID